jgi:hypothetical protein
MITVKCQYCGKEFKTKDCLLIKNKGKFCSIKCFANYRKGKPLNRQNFVFSDESKKKMSLSQKKRFELNPKNKERFKLKCLNCGKEFETVNSKIKNGRKFCCKLCFYQYQKGLKRKELGVETTCDICGKIFRIYPYRLKESGVHTCSKECFIIFLASRDVTVETRKKLSLKSLGHKLSLESRLKIKKSKIGKKNPNWKGGISDINKKIRTSMIYRQWQNIIFKRDNYKCCICGKKSKNLNGHHLCGFSEFPELRFNPDNGVTICKKCHDYFHSIFGKQNITPEQFIEFLNNEQNG